jgi:signal transduction histidine kinase
MTPAIAPPATQPLSSPEPNLLRDVTPREFELAGIIDAYNRVTEKLKQSHETLTREVRRLRTQLREKDRELERRERLAALGEMAAGVAHEVRNPLGGILLYAQMLEKDLNGQNGPRRMAEQIASAARKLDEIVADILAFAGRCEPQCRPLRLRPVIEEVVQLLRPRWATASCTVDSHWNLPDDIIEADATQLQRALLNLIANAIEAAGSSGRVSIHVGPDDDPDRPIRIRVSDNGPGVPPELRDRIFNPFFTTKDSGTGLGLAIVHRIVELHNGRIALAERDGGATFVLSLPKQRPGGKTD